MTNNMTTGRRIGYGRVSTVTQTEEQQRVRVSLLSTIKARHPALANVAKGM